MIQIKKEIESICGKVIDFPGFGYLFKINNIDCMCMKTSKKDQLRFVVPCAKKIPISNQNEYMNRINQVNKELRYVKILLLDTGCIVVNYDYKLVSNANYKEIVYHIIRVISFAVTYISDRINDSTEKNI